MPLFANVQVVDGNGHATDSVFWFWCDPHTREIDFRVVISFRQHVLKHFLDPLEPWSKFLPRKEFDQIRGQVLARYTPTFQALGVQEEDAKTRCEILSLLTTVHPDLVCLKPQTLAMSGLVGMLVDQVSGEQRFLNYLSNPIGSEQSKFRAIRGRLASILGHIRALRPGVTALSWGQLGTGLTTLCQEHHPESVEERNETIGFWRPIYEWLTSLLPQALNWSANCPLYFVPDGRPETRKFLCRGGYVIVAERCEGESQHFRVPTVFFRGNPARPWRQWLDQQHLPPRTVLLRCFRGAAQDYRDCGNHCFVHEGNWHLLANLVIPGGAVDYGFTADQFRLTLNNAND